MLRRCCDASSPVAERQSADCVISRPGSARSAPPLALTLGLSRPSAEGFFQTLFGWGSSRRIRAHRAADLQLRLRRPAARLRPGLRSPATTPGRRTTAIPDAVRAHCATGSISPSATASAASGSTGCRACSQRCDGEAKLFYYPTNGGSVETMVDMAGHRYAQTAERVPLSQGAGAGLHVQAGAVVGGGGAHGTRATRPRRRRHGARKHAGRRLALDRAGRKRSREVYA